MLQSLSNNLLWSQGVSVCAFIGIMGAVGLIFRKGVIVGCAVLLFVFSLYFFRNPVRICPEAQRDARVLICPADGQVVAVDSAEHPLFQEFTQRVAIYLSPLDVHVQWMPCAGTIEKISYHPGAFAFAFLPKASVLNEHTDVSLLTPYNERILVRQIAGTVARRIVWWVHEEQSMQAGEKYGMIRFGSRVEIFLPSSTTIAVKVGQRVRGGQSVLGILT